MAASLKLAGGGPAMLGQNAVVFAPPVRVLTVEVELLLGLWLLSGWNAVAARRAALVFFTILAGVSLWLAWQGQSSCGCLGRIAVHPWTTFAFDAAAILVLAAIRTGPQAASPRIGEFVRLAGGAVLLLVLTAAGAMAYLGVGAAEALARVKGEALIVEPSELDLGEGASGEGRKFELRLTNRSGRTVAVVGGPQSCPCALDADLPQVIEPGQTLVLPLLTKFSGTPGAFRNQFTLYTDDVQQWAVTVRVRGVVKLR